MTPNISIGKFIQYKVTEKKRSWITSTNCTAKQWLKSRTHQVTDERSNSKVICLTTQSRHWVRGTICRFRIFSLKSLFVSSYHLILPFVISPALTAQTADDLSTTIHTRPHCLTVAYCISEKTNTVASNFSDIMVKSQHCTKSLQHHWATLDSSFELSHWKLMVWD